MTFWTLLILTYPVLGEDFVVVSAAQGPPCQVISSSISSRR